MATHGVLFGLFHHQAVQLCHLLADGLQRRQQAANRRIQQVVALRGRDHLLLEGLAVAPLQDGAEDLQQTPDLVLQVGLYTDQLRPGAEHARIWWLSRLLTPTSRYQPVRMICARPSASFLSVLLICMLRAA